MLPSPRRGKDGAAQQGEGELEMGSTTRRRRRVGPTDEWEQLALLCLWPEQRAYEEIRPLTLFGSSVAERRA